MENVTLEGFRPAPHYSGVYSQARVERSLVSANGPWTETWGPSAITPAPDPTKPPKYNFTVSADSKLGWWRVVFIDATAATSTTPAITFDGYPSAAELVSRSDVDDLVEATDEEQDAWYMAAKQSVEDFCNQRFDLRTATLIVGAQGGRTLYLPERIESVTAVDMPHSGLVLSDLLINDDHDALIVREDVGRNYYEAILTEGTRLSFPKQGQDVTVTGSWGWPAVPDAVALAIQYDMEDQARADSSQLSGGFASLRAMGATEIAQAGMRVKFGAARPIVSERVERILSPRYVWQPALGTVV